MEEIEQICKEENLLEARDRRLLKTLVRFALQVGRDEVPPPPNSRSDMAIAGGLALRSKRMVVEGRWTGGRISWRATRGVRLRSQM